MRRAKFIIVPAMRAKAMEEFKTIEGACKVLNGGKASESGGGRVTLFSMKQKQASGSGSSAVAVATAVCGACRQDDSRLAGFAFHPVVWRSFLCCLRE